MSDLEAVFRRDQAEAAAGHIDRALEHWTGQCIGRPMPPTVQQAFIDQLATITRGPGVTVCSHIDATAPGIPVWMPGVSATVLCGPCGRSAAERRRDMCDACGTYVDYAATRGLTFVAGNLQSLLIVAMLCDVCLAAA